MSIFGVDKISYKNYVKGYSCIAIPMFELIKKDVEFKWNPIVKLPLIQEHECYALVSGIMHSDNTYFEIISHSELTPIDGSTHSKTLASRSKTM